MYIQVSTALGEQLFFFFLVRERELAWGAAREEAHGRSRMGYQEFRAQGPYDDHTQQLLATIAIRCYS